MQQVSRIIAKDQRRWNRLRHFQPSSTASRFTFTRDTTVHLIRINFHIIYILEKWVRKTTQAFTSHGRTLLGWIWHRRPRVETSLFFSIYCHTDSFQFCILFCLCICLFMCSAYWFNIYLMDICLWPAHVISVLHI